MRSFSSFFVRETESLQTRILHPVSNWDAKPSARIYPAQRPNHFPKIGYDWLDQQ